MLLCIIYSLIVLVVILTLQLVSLITEIMSYTTHVALTVPAKLLNKEIHTQIVRFVVLLCFVLETGAKGARSFFSGSSFYQVDPNQLDTKIKLIVSQG